MNYRVVLSRVLETKNFDRVRSTKTVEVIGKNSYDACTQVFSQETTRGWKIAHLFERNSEKWDKIF